MGKIGEEITQKIKSAVKAKLIELGVEVDNELPDYIMVLVANKKTQSQMEKDLQLFLGSNTVLFTTWLLNVLKKLEEVTVSKKNYKRIEVANEDDSLVVMKKEEDLERRQALKRSVKIKVEPGTESDAAEQHLQISTVEDGNVEEDNPEGMEEQDENSSDEDSVQVDTAGRSPLVNSEYSRVETETTSNVNDASPDSQKISLSGRNSDAEPEEVSSHEESPSVIPDTKGNDAGDDIARPKVIYGITEQIDKVMEKTINGNRRTREDHCASPDPEFRRNFRDRSKSFDDSKSRGGRKKSQENDFYETRRKMSRERTRSRERRKSPDDYARRRSPDNRRRPFNDHRRSPDFRRKSPAYRRRVTEFSRRSPEARRRSPFGRRNSPEDRWRSRSPIDRRKSPFERRRSPEVRRRVYEERGRRDESRRSPDDRGKPHMLDAREILKRRTNKTEDLNFELASNDDSHRSEKRRKVVSSLVHKPDDGKDKSSEPQIPSLVRVTPRPLRKDAIQPNKKLLLLAVADAEKSVSRPHKRHSSPSNSSHAISRKDEVDTEDPDSTPKPPEERPKNKTVSHRSAVLALETLNSYFVQQGNRSDSEMDLLKNWKNEILVEMYETVQKPL